MIAMTIFPQKLNPEIDIADFRIPGCQELFIVLWINTMTDTMITTMMNTKMDTMIKKENSLEISCSLIIRYREQFVDINMIPD